MDDTRYRIGQYRWSIPALSWPRSMMGSPLLSCWLTCRWSLDNWNLSFIVEKKEIIFALFFPPPWTDVSIVLRVHLDSHPHPYAAIKIFHAMFYSNSIIAEPCACFRMLPRQPRLWWWWWPIVFTVRISIDLTPSHEYDINFTPARLKREMGLLATLLLTTVNLFFFRE